MTGITILEIKDEITYDEIVEHAMEIIQPDYRSPEKIREYAANLVREKANERRSTLDRERVAEFQYDTYPPVEGNIYDMLFEGKEFSKGAIKRAGSLVGLDPTDLLPIDRDNLQTKIATAYEKISGKPYPERKKGEPHFYAMLVLNPLENLL